MVEWGEGKYEDLQEELKELEKKVKRINR